VFAPCCSEYGYCHARADWAAGLFRDCNTISNGQPLPLGVLQREYIERLAGRRAAGNTLLGLAGGLQDGERHAFYNLYWQADYTGRHRASLNHVNVNVFYLVCLLKQHYFNVKHY
jgi:hypothetical protein